MFDKEIYKVFNGVKVVWYPKEMLCLVVKKNSIRTYKRVPKKYLNLKKSKRSSL